MTMSWCFLSPRIDTEFSLTNGPAWVLALNTAEPVIDAVTSTWFTSRLVIGNRWSNEGLLLFFAPSCLGVGWVGWVMG